KEIIIDTKPGDNGRPRAIVTARYTFSKVVTRTAKRAENILDLSVVRRAKMPPWLLGHQWSGDSPGARLRQARVAKNMTIRDLAAATGLSVTAIGSLEADKFNATLPHLRSLASGQRITKARLYHGLTKEEMARAIGVDQKTLRSWEQDKHQPLQRYSTVLDAYLAMLSD
ncbi:MAG: Helix-turn-helix protein, partial [Desulfotomaculum sp. 46_296]